MVLDDEPTVRMFVAEVMAELGYATMEAGDGAEALGMLRSGARIDLLVSDVGLPGGMNGPQVADAVRVGARSSKCSSSPATARALRSARAISIPACEC